MLQGDAAGGPFPGRGTGHEPPGGGGGGQRPLLLLLLGGERGGLLVVGGPGVGVLGDVRVLLHDVGASVGRAHGRLRVGGNSKKVMAIEISTEIDLVGKGVVKDNMSLLFEKSSFK